MERGVNMIPKIKAWDRKRKEMIRVISINFDENFVRGLSEVESNVDIESSYNFDEVDIIQSTGIFDRSGIEIYEGYIIKYANKIDTVVMKNDMWSVSNSHLSLYAIVTLSDKGVEVIGNKFENPELLHNNS